MKKPLVSILIVSWNGKKHLKTCLASLARVEYPKLETILVDNGSRDGSVKFVQENYPATKIIPNKKNLGFARANNQGFQKARGKYVLLLNNDIRVETDFLKPLVAQMEKDNTIGAVQPLILSWDGKKIQSTGSLFTPSGFLYHRGYRQKIETADQPNSGPIFAGNGSALLLRRKLIKQIGLFDKDYWMYFEESDLCNRIWLSGHQVVFEPKSVVYHRGRATSQKIDRPLVQFHSFKNRLQTYLKNLGTRQLLLTLPHHLLYMQLASIAYLLVKKSLPLSWAVQKAILWNMVNLPRTVERRRHIQSKVRQTSDKSFLPPLTKKPPPKYYYHLLTDKPPTAEQNPVSRIHSRS